MITTSYWVLAVILLALGGRCLGTGTMERGAEGREAAVCPADDPAPAVGERRRGGAREREGAAG